MNRKVAVLALCLAAPALAGCGDDDDQSAAARPDHGAPVEFALEPRHHATVTGTAVIVPGVRAMKVTLQLDEPVPGTLLAHIHTGPCSDEPTASNPRIWATLTEVIDGRSETKEDLMTLGELQAETTSINVHDPTHGNRTLVCGDIPQAG